MLSFIQTLFRKSVGRPAFCLALYAPNNESLDLQAGLDWVLMQTRRLELPQAEWVTWNYGDPSDVHYKTYKLDSWMRRGRVLPASVCTSMETGRFLSEGRQGLADYLWYACLSKSSSVFILCVDLEVRTLAQSVVENIIVDTHEITQAEYGYGFEMEMEKGPAFYAEGGTLNGCKYFSQLQIEEIAKWTHAKGESEKLGLPVGDLLRDVFSLNFINPHHLGLQVKGQSLKDWIEADPKRGSLKPLIEGKLWSWSVPENRIQAIRKVLGPERLLISWGDFNTPSGGPLGHTYGAKKGEGPPAFSGLPLTKKDERWIADGLKTIQPIFTRYTGESAASFDKLLASKELLFDKLLDMAFTSWSEDTRPDRPDAEESLQAFSAALGERLVKRYRMGWYVLEDEHGRSLGVCHRGPGGSQTWAHPVDSVAKRIDRKETGFVVGIIEAVGEQIKQG